MKPLDQCRLYAFVDTACLHGRAPEGIARQLCEGGADLIQLRAKSSSPGEILRLAETILPITRQACVRLVINDHVDVARSVGAELCHLGHEDFFGAGHTRVEEVSGDGYQVSGEKGEGERAKGRLGIGLSTHAPEQARQAIDAGAVYVAAGPVYATGTKPQAKPVTLEYVRWAAAHVTIPWFAIGGINLANLDAVLAAGATRICVVSAILNADNPAQACAEFRKRLDQKL